MQWRRVEDYVQKHGRHAGNEAGPPPQATDWRDLRRDCRRGAECAPSGRFVSDEPGEIGPPGGFSQSRHMASWGAVRHMKILENEPAQAGRNRAPFDSGHWGLIRRRKNQAILIRLSGVVRRFLLLLS